MMSVQLSTRMSDIPGLSWETLLYVFVHNPGLAVVGHDSGLRLWGHPLKIPLQDL